jgi:hypothetical protein
MDVERVLPPGSKEFGTFKELFAGSWEISKVPRRRKVAGSRGNATSGTPRR